MVVSRVASVGLALFGLWIAPAIAAEPVNYLRDIKPIFKERCFACHGALKQESNLRLDTGGAIRQGGDGGAAVVVGKAAESSMIQRVSASDLSERMPPEGMPLTAEQIALLKAWIDQGAASPEKESPEEDPREHWAFRAPVRPEIPELKDTSGLDARQNAVDGLLAARHQKEGLKARPPAEKHVLLRRVYLDLIGLPPTPAELREYLADDSPQAFDKVVDRLLNDPRYGERWGRHWMDIWRYSDWYGRRHVPDVWNSASQLWRWRDWIVRSLNQDHGYDRMIREMLAADEICPEDDEATVATGYLVRNWYALNPNDWMRNTVEHTGKAFLGLTFNCAHCHDHKYDPIAHTDYFALRAFFEPIDVRQDRVPGEADPGPFQEYEYSVLRKIQRLGAVRIFDKTPQAPTWFYTGGDERNRVTERGSIAPGLPAFLSPAPLKIEEMQLPPRFWYPGLRPGIQETVLADLRQAIEASQAEIAAARQAQATLKADEPAGQAAALRLRAAEARQTAATAELASAEARMAADRARYGETPNADAAALATQASQLEREAQVKQAEADILAAESALAIATSKPAADANRAKDMEAANAQLTAGRAALDKARAALADPALADKYTPFSPQYPQTSTGRRKALAEWITRRDNPLAARVAVNHIWARHFHEPLVASVYDFGRNGARPTHPEVLDYLAVELMESGWSMKHLHRLIVTSAAYRRASSAGASQREAKVDPENKLLWRMNPGRMEAEVVRDSLLYAAGRLQTKMGGQELENSESLTTNRRSIYYSTHPEADGKSAFGELFDGPEALECYRRTQSVVPQQALALTNSELVHQLSGALAAALWADTERPGQEPAGRNTELIAAAFKRVLSRSPTAAETEKCLAFLDKQASGTAAAEREAMARESLVRVLLNHNDFVTIR